MPGSPLDLPPLTHSRLGSTATTHPSYRRIKNPSPLISGTTSTSCPLARLRGERSEGAESAGGEGKRRPSFVPAHPHPLGKLHNHAATTAQHAAGIQPNAGGITHHDHAELMVIMTVASCLARNGTARLARHFCTIGPKRGC